MADPLANYVPDWVKNDEPMREPIVKLAKMITDRVPIVLGTKKLQKEDPEYWGLATICTDEMAEIALKMGKRKPRTMDDMVKLTGKSRQYLEDILEEMAVRGLVEYNYENPQHEKQYILPMFVPGSAEFTNMNREILKEHPEMARFFERMSRLPLEEVVPMVPPGGAGIGMHVIPVEKAIDMESKSISIEHISHWLEKYEGKYAASPCSCRLSRSTYDEGCADDPSDWCIAVGDMADYVVETNKGGRYITKEEALEIFQKAEDNGFVHQITNIDGEDKIFAICNCNVNVCYALRTSQLFNTPNLSRSAYVAHIDNDKCVACGRCVEFCPAGAVSLGQKLCKKDGSKMDYPVKPLPSQKKWSKEDWTENYRDVNRINTHESGTAPCKTACPAHIAVQGYLKLASEGKYKEALALIKKNNPLPAICGHVCNRRCEDACTRGTIDEAIAIDEVKKFIAMQDLDSKYRYVPPKVVPAVKGFFPEKVAIIGGGPAGISCAYYLAEKGYKPTIFEKNQKLGGMVMYGIPSFVLEKDIVESEIDVLREMGVEFKCGIEVGKDITIQQLREQGYKAFYIGIGCQKGKKAGVSGENAKGVMTAVDFLHMISEDETIKLAGNTVVIGGGNVAIDASRTAKRCGQGNVYQVSLETKENMPASAEEISIAEKEEINLKGGWGPKEILSENGKVAGIVFKKCVSVYDSQGKFAPCYDEEETFTVECDNVILSVGQTVEWGGLLEGEDIELNDRKMPVADAKTYQTSVADIFTGGDVLTGPKFAIDAIAAGKEAAISIHRFVQPGSTLTIGRNPNYYVELDKDDILIESYDTSKRQIPGVNESVGKDSFKDSKLVFTEDQIKKETARCLSCGLTIVDPNQCIGCGLCTTKCEFDAIHLKRDIPQASTMRKSEDKLKYILPYGAKQAIKIKLSRKDK